MEKQIAYLQTEMATLQSQKHPLTVANVIDNEQKMLMYPSLKPQMFRIIDSTLQRFPLVYVDSWTPSAFSRTDQLFMTLMKLKLNCPFLDLAERFCTSKATIHNIIITHVFALHEVFFEGMMENNILSLLKCKASMPAIFGDFNCCRLVIDATEVTQDVPGQDMTAQSQTYSSYKNRHTVKSVTGVAPNGAVVYVSKLYPGSTSDVAIVKHSNMLAKLSPGDMILADKEFTIHSLLPQGIHLNIPPFLKDKGQYTPAEVQVCRKIARSRIHAERVNERIKYFEILSHIPQQFRHISTKIFQVCAMLVNFQNPMIADIANNYSFDL
uniref:DDE Tnp4 domain-containing protein n=1 Tax=Magallana gigas TaxID=29159 RepID=A0A8W8MG00_MAGGI